LTLVLAWQKPRGWRRVWWPRVNASCAVERCASPDSARLRARSLGLLAHDTHTVVPPCSPDRWEQVYSCDERGQMPSGEYVHTACLKYQKMNSGAPPPPSFELSQRMKLRSVDSPTSWKCRRRCRPVACGVRLGKCHCVSRRGC
jgi:hypothetical protein